MSRKKGGFTLPGEAGCEALTLELAEKWGADVIRDSDGTALSDEILNAGYDIYSTICIIRDHNAWAKEHPQYLQQSILMSTPVVADGKELRLNPMDGYFTEQFKLNDSPDSLRYWQVYDRTTGEELDRSKWDFVQTSGEVLIRDAVPFHEYTVNFFAYRIWEEISMYNHVTNNWDKEHLMPVDPRAQEAQDYLTGWMDKWCKEHPATNVVRFTSMFYNFVWIWGADERNRNLFTDWGSYDFTVSPQALDEFEKAYGYALTTEDFINKGKLHVTHMAPNQKQRDYMAFTNRFVVDYGKKLVDLVHSYGKKAYVFYDDSWVGVEPYSALFPEFGFDGLIKCVFSGYEVRLCAGAKVETHEIRLHPYLFPVGLGGKPTFSEGGDPTTDAKEYWIAIRRALLRKTVDRIGLGGYLHLLEDFPDFVDYIEKISDEFRDIKELHANGGPETLPLKVAVLHAWGSLRSWTLSGHFHETYMHDLIHINEALSGLPVDVEYISFEDVKKGALKGVDVVINAGRKDTAWSGGDAWKDAELVSTLLQWVKEGGCFVGVGEPSATDGFVNYFRMAPALGVDEDTGARVCHGKWAFDTVSVPGLIPEGAYVKGRDGRYLTDGKAEVLLSENLPAVMGDNVVPALSVHNFGKGKGIYLASFEKNNANNRLLLNLLMYGAGKDLNQKWITDNANTECAYYPADKKLIVVNNSAESQVCKVNGYDGKFTMQPYETQILDV